MDDNSDFGLLRLDFLEFGDVIEEEEEDVDATDDIDSILLLAPFPFVLLLLLLFAVLLSSVGNCISLFP